ncbi:MAG: hypothetical protein Q8920_16500 [Bacillota bacterium]|nr:hypothetical protein [Bacillota bacterium]
MGIMGLCVKLLLIRYEVYLYDDKVRIIFNASDRPITIDCELLNEIENIENSGVSGSERCSYIKDNAPPEKIPFLFRKRYFYIYPAFQRRKAGQKSPLAGEAPKMGANVSLESFQASILDFVRSVPTPSLSYPPETIVRDGFTGL